MLSIMNNMHNVAPLFLPYLGTGISAHSAVNQKANVASQIQN